MMGTEEYIEYYKSCNLWVDALIDLVNDYCDCFPDETTDKLKAAIDKYESTHKNNRAKMQEFIY